MANLLIVLTALALVASCAAHSNLITGEKGSAEGGYTFANKTDLQVGVNLWMTDEQAAEKTYGNITDWDVSEVPDLSSLFYGKAGFNADISSWDTSGVTSMAGMFQVQTLAPTSSRKPFPAMPLAPSPPPTALSPPGPHRSPSHRMPTLRLGRARPSTSR